VSLAALPPVERDLVDLDPADTLEAVLSAGKVWLGISDSTHLALLRQALEERKVLREIVMATQSPDARRSLRDLDKQIIAELSALGFDPSSRARLGLAEVKAQSTLERLRHG
jgi:hypothetical protein